MIEMLNEDCMEVMARYPDKWFDLACVDPPYGHNITGGHNNENGWKNHLYWKKATHGWNQKPTDMYFQALFRVSKNQIIWGGNYFNLLPSEGWIVWDKGQRNFSLADGELAWTSFDKALRIFNYSRSLSNFKDNRIHPTQKPVALYKWLLHNYATPDMKILDTHGGSGSSAIACHYFGADMVWTELDKEYYDAAVARFTEQTRQVQLL